MNFVSLEEKGKKIFSKFPKTRRFLKGIYQRISYIFSKNKIRSEGNIVKISPNDGYEYFFGYYDKSPWDITDRYMISLRVKNAHKKPDSTDVAEVVVFDTKENNNMEVIGTTHCWNTQQGCMAQWLGPNFSDKIIYNDFRDNKFVSVIYNFSAKQEEKVFDMPIYDVSKDGSFALTLDFTRLHRLRKGYGYANIKEETRKEKCPDKPCIWKIDFKSGKISPVIKYTDLANFETRKEMENAEHKVNHIMISPNGKRFMVLHRWFKHNEKFTRLVTMSIDGTDMYNLSDDNFVSHCCWKNDKEILSFLNKKETGKHYYLMKDKTNEYHMQWEELNTDGHCTYSPNGKYVITDIYPNRKRIASVYLCEENKHSKKLVSVFAPFKYDNDVRCDLHPRWDHKNEKICIDSVYEGKKGLYIINVCVDKSKIQSKKNKKLVSIIIPCYNAEDYLIETLNSIENQTYENIEIICINDGSTDQTQKILEEWHKNTKIRNVIINQNNLGVSYSRNIGIEKAKGKYIMFCDSDDLFREDLVSVLMNEIEVEGSETAYCRLKRQKNDIYDYSKKITIIKKKQSEAMEDLLYKMSEISFDCYIYNKSVLDKHSIRFDIKTKYGEDREFNWKYLCWCKKVSYIDNALYYYRINDKSATRKVPTWEKTDLLCAIKRIEKYLKDNDCDFYNELKSYFYSRAIWTVAKTFAMYGQKDLYKKFIKEYKIKKHMKQMVKDKQKSVSIGSVLYLIHPSLFYFVLSKFACK